jgi:hypothetical protein
LQAILNKGINTFSNAINALTLKMRVHIGLVSATFRRPLKDSLREAYGPALTLVIGASYRRANNGTAIIKRHTSLAFNTLRKRVVL